MSNFTALNIEPDDNPDDEVDNTRELQIEDALKLYQTALKLHSQGPNHYAEAVEAYRNLLRSDIFAYPESVTEFNRIEAHPELDATELSLVADLDLVPAGEDGSSTLPQILYLAYKNHGQFILDCLKARLQHPDVPPDEVMDKRATDYQAKAALENFALGLARDESDTELWRRAARVGATLGSRRIARYCLEAAVEVDDDPTIAEVEPPSLEEGFAGKQLLEQLNVLYDEPALSHPIMAPFMKKDMPALLTKRMDPYPFLPNPTTALGITGDTQHDTFQPRVVIDVPQVSWTALGISLRTAIVSPQENNSLGVMIRFPSKNDEIPAATEEIFPPNLLTQDDQVMEDTGMSVSPIAESSDIRVGTPAADKIEEPSVEIVTLTSVVPLTEDGKVAKSVSLPTRKRSQSTAGIPDATEDESGAQKRSKRIRNRADTTEEVDFTAQYAEQLKGFKRADEDVFEFVNDLLTKLGVENLKSYRAVEAAIENENGASEAGNLTDISLKDLRNILREWDDAKEITFLSGSAADILGSSAGSASAGLATFLEHSKSAQLKLANTPGFRASEGISNFVDDVNAQWMPVQDVVLSWLRCVLIRYQDTLWPDELKAVVAQLISFVDPDIFSTLQLEVQRLTMARNGREDFDAESLKTLEEIVQTLFELHLDVVSRITNPSSLVDYDTRVLARERLDRWAEFSANIMRYPTGESSDDQYDDLSLRYLWASVFYATMTENISREHKVLLWSDLQEFLRKAGNPIIALPNNVVMPEISVEAAESEVSRLTTLDFFFNLFQTNNPDPLAIIEALEPVLDPTDTSSPIAEDQTVDAEPCDQMPAALREMWKFLKTGSASLRLFLWQRLLEAYLNIGYTTKVFSCHLKCIEIVVDDLRSVDYVESAEDPRRHKLLTWLKALDDLLVKALTLALNSTEAAFEIIDDRHLKSTCAALAQLNRMLHTAAMFDDEVRVGMIQLPTAPAYGPHGSFTLFMNKLREMQIRTWSLQYAMLREAMAQNPEIYRNPGNDQADFLALIHYSLGLRRYCKISNKIFIKMMKVELLRLKDVDRRDDYLGQVLFDLYGIRLGIGSYLLEDHGCPIEPLDKRTVLNIAEEVIDLANKMPMKDLLKHELRSTIEKMQTAVGAHKTTPQMTHNLRNYTEYLKTSIHPLDMYKAPKGLVQVDSLPASSQESPLADKGWYFLLGVIALAKFRSQKRTGPGSQTDDLRVAATFLRLQLQFSGDRWETWYRLAQCFDYELEEEVLWSADKINNHRQELVKLQRCSIHCYIMALSTAVQMADDTPATVEKLREMYYDFGMRLYASSREPFSMEAFWVDEFEKHMSGQSGMYKKPLHEEMRRFRVWQYAATLFKRSMVDKVNNWMNHFMLGKCLWKMYCKADDGPWAHVDSLHKPSMDTVLSAFVNAIRTVPKPKDSRQESILEPHYKLVSIVHKLVHNGHLAPQSAANLLQEQPYAVRKGEPVVIAQRDAWEPFILEYLRHLRNADKSHWQHRMIARVANILYDENNLDYVQASAARHELRESIFTRTMHIQVWKPEAERPGRHCVYMERYVRLMTKLLWMVNDKPNMEQLTKRVRKKANELFMFTQVWIECCTTYLRLIRRAAEIPVSLDEAFKSVSHDEFEASYERLTAWISGPNATHPAIDALREAVELKKLNANQMKSTPIDDLIGDCWAVLHTQVSKSLPDTEQNGTPLLSTRQAQLDGEAASAGLSSNPFVQPASQARNSGPMSLNNLVMDMGSGTQIPVPVTVAAHSQILDLPRVRKLGISRREVLRRAELAITRLSEGQKVTAAGGRPRNSEIGVPILGSNAPPLQHTNSEKSEHSGRQAFNSHENRDGKAGNQSEWASQAEDEQEEPRENQDDDGSSDKGSLHDSADDESDLSDVPDMDDEDIQARISDMIQRADGPRRPDGSTPISQRTPTPQAGQNKESESES